MEMKIDVDDKLITDALSCAFEGGIRYWARLVDRKYGNAHTVEDFQQGGQYYDNKYHYSVWALMPLVPGCTVVIQDYGENKNYLLTRLELQKGLEAMYKKYPHTFGRLLAEDCDGDVGDVFVQCCLFGEAIYG